MGAVLLLSRGKSKAHVLILPEPLPSCCGELTSLFSFFFSPPSFRQDKNWCRAAFGAAWGGHKRREQEMCPPVFQVNNGGGAKLKSGRRWRAGKSLGSDPWGFNSLLKLV